jgi:hypothetical protein
MHLIPPGYSLQGIAVQHIAASQAVAQIYINSLFLVDCKQYHLQAFSLNRSRLFSLGIPVASQIQMGVGMGD